MEKLKELYLDTETADIRFSFEPTGGGGACTAVKGKGKGKGAVTQIAAHKNLLAGTSDVFKAMFYGKMKETGSNVHVPDVSEAAFVEFLQYFYTDKVKLSAEHVEEVLYLGQKYNVEKCVNDSVQYLIKLLDDENVCSRLSLAILYAHENLMKACEKHILLNSEGVFRSAGFLACDRQVLAHILKKNLTLCAETVVFEAMMSWVKAKSKQNIVSKELVETHLGDLFYDIRFATMKIEEFCALAKQYDPILSAHHKTITNMIVLKETSDQFESTPRYAERCSDTLLRCNRTRQESKIPLELDLIETMKFSTNQPFVLTSFTCSAIFDEHCHVLKSDLPVDVKIYECRGRKYKMASGSLLLEMKANLKSENVRVALPQPVIVKTKSIYDIRIGPLPQGYRCYSYNPAIAVYKFGFTIDFHCHNYDNDDDSESDSDSSSDSDKRMANSVFIRKLEFRPIIINT